MANLKNKEKIVVKTLKESATHLEEKEFREEALLLSKLHFDHIVKTMGICLQSKPMMLALEYIDGSSINHFLSRKDVRKNLDGLDLLLMVQDAAKACDYIAKEGYIHRDIAARNLLVELDTKNTWKPRLVKLTDFGLAKDVGNENYSSRTPDTNNLPIAWSAPEAFIGQFSPKSDVWSFGVVIWEVYSWASQPFGQCNTSSRHKCPLKSYTHEEIEIMVKDQKNILNCTDPCIATFSDHHKDIMHWCYSFEPEERPTFSQLCKFLQKKKSQLVDIRYKQPLEKHISLNQADSSGYSSSAMTPAYGSQDSRPSVQSTISLDSVFEGKEQQELNKTDICATIAYSNDLKEKRGQANTDVLNINVEPKPEKTYIPMETLNEEQLSDLAACD